MSVVIREFKETILNSIEENHAVIDEAKKNIEELNEALKFIERKE